MNTTSQAARQMLAAFQSIKARGGHAAIDFKDGELALLCTKPNVSNPPVESWGRGAVPQSYTDGWVRLMEC